MRGKLPRIVALEERHADVTQVRLGRLPTGHQKGGDYSRRGPFAIRIAQGSTSGEARYALLHESLHFCWERSGLGEQYSDATEESIISGLSGWLMVLLRENPDLVEFVTAEE